MTERRTLIVIRKPPFGSVDSWEAMRLALSFYAQRAPVSVALEGPGVLNWVSNMIPEATSPRSVSRFVEDLGKFSVPVYLVLEDLGVAGFTPNDLASPHAQIIQRSEFAHMVASHDAVVAI
jgi:sulfur relay (sulfurtransferase) DsrF/TusC family protein